MKRFAAVLLAALLLTAGCAAFAETDTETFTYPNAFSFDYPADWSRDSETYADESADEQIWVTCVFDDTAEGVGVNVWMEKLSAYEDYASRVSNPDTFSLFRATEEEIGAYAAFLSGCFEDTEAEYYDTIYAESGAVKVPFVVLGLTDEEGYSLYCSTVANGWEISFLANRTDGEVLTEEQMAETLVLIYSFRPEVGA